MHIFGFGRKWFTGCPNKISNNKMKYHPPFYEIWPKGLLYFLFIDLASISVPKIPIPHCKWALIYLAVRNKYKFWILYSKFVKMLLYQAQCEIIISILLAWSNFLEVPVYKVARYFENKDKSKQNSLKKNWSKYISMRLFLAPTSLFLELSFQKYSTGTSME